MDKNGYVYIMTNRKHWTLYVGVTSNLFKRVWEHKTWTYHWFTAKYGLKQLVYFEEYSLIVDAIQREKQLKAWSRIKKIALIEDCNNAWKDLAEEWYDTWE